MCVHMSVCVCVCVCACVYVCVCVYVCACVEGGGEGVSTSSHSNDPRPLKSTWRHGHFLGLLTGDMGLKNIVP